MELILRFLKDFFFLFLIMCLVMYRRVCTLCECSNCGGQKRASDNLELELQGVVSPPTWVLGIELKSYVRVV